MKRQILKASEKEIQNSIIEYLKLKGWYVMRLNSGNVSRDYRGKTYFIRGQEAGTPDLLAFKKRCVNCMDDPEHDVRLMFIEVKKLGNKATSLQTAKMQELREYGAYCCIATGVESLQLVGI